MQQDEGHDASTWSEGGEAPRSAKRDDTSSRHGFLPPWVTTVFVAAALALAGFLLYRTLGRYDLDELVASVRSIGTRHLLLAIGWAAASYLCLTGFDWLALHYVRRPLPYSYVALTSFSSLSIGHNIGFAALSSGAIRYRFYSRAGLTTEEIAKVILFCGITVALGLLVLAGIALLLRPGLAQEIIGVRRAGVLAMAAACLAIPAIYLGLASSLRRPLCFRRWSMEMPSLRLAMAQIVIGPLNFACVAACLHQALSGLADVAYPAVAAVYVIANTATLISHVPGGLGVIESVVLYLLPQADLIGAVLVFRFVYFLLPLSLGLLLFGATELRLRFRHLAGDEGAGSAVQG